MIPKATRLAAFFCWLLGISGAVTWGQTIASHEPAPRFPFVIPGFDATVNATDFSHLNAKPAGSDGFVRIRDGHFATKSDRLKIWGVNFSFGANFPSHQDAERVAAHLAKIGINGVRIHHHDSAAAPQGLFTTDGEWDAEQVDRLDYFLAELHRHGIYANINLHVGRSIAARLGLPKLGNDHSNMGDKPLLHFHPKIQQAFRDYCRELLAHTNPYRQLTRVNDPAIAMVEIANENRFSQADARMLLDAPPVHRNVIRKRWNQWLKQNYASTAQAREAWAAPAAARCVLGDSEEWSGTDLGRWSISDNRGKSPVSIDVSNEGVLRLTPQVAAPKSWNQQLGLFKLRLVKDQAYIVRFDVKSDAEKTIELNAATMLEGTWRSAGLQESIASGVEWKSHAFQFVANTDAPNIGMITFNLGSDQNAVEFRNAEVVEGGTTVTVPEGESIEAGNVSLPSVVSTTRTHEAFRRFMFDMEREFYVQTMDFLKNELGVRVPITTTQVNYAPIELTREVADYADMHAYWHHPIFPKQEWDKSNWTVGNDSLTAKPFSDRWPRCNLLMRTHWRLAGKPFTFSEWNVGEPSFCSADAIAVAAILASLQDWDAVFFYNYHNSHENWNRDSLGEFFDLNGQPTKVALVASMANLFRRADLPALQQTAYTKTPIHRRTAALALTHLVGIQSTSQADSTDSNPVLPTAAELERPESRRLQSPGGTVTWDAQTPDQATVIVNTPKSIVVWGHVGNRTFKVGPLRFKFGKCERDYAVMVMTSRDDKRLLQSESILLTIVGNAENQRMGWNANRTSVGREWGEGPTVANGIPCEITWDEQPQVRRGFALLGTGERGEEIRPVANEWRVGPEFKTLWYEFSAKKSAAAQ